MYLLPQFSQTHQNALFYVVETSTGFSLLYRNKVKIKFKKAARRKDEKYQIVFCDVRRKDVEKFIRAMEELKNKMLLIGNIDYEAFCEELLPDLAE